MSKKNYKDFEFLDLGDDFYYHTNEKSIYDNLSDDYELDILYKITEKNNVFKWAKDKEDYYYCDNDSLVYKSMIDYHNYKKSEYMKTFFDVVKCYEDIIDTDETKKERLSLIITPSLYKAIKDISKVSNTSVNEIITLTIIKTIKEYINKTAARTKKHS